MQVQLECYSLRVRAKMRLWALFTINLLLSFEWVFLISTASPPRYRGRCWAAIQLSHRPELSGCVVRGEVNGLDSEGRHGRRFVLRHTHRPQRRPYPISTGRKAVEPDPDYRLATQWQRSCLQQAPQCSAGVCWVVGLRQHFCCRTLRRAFDDPPYAEHIQYR